MVKKIIPKMFEKVFNLSNNELSTIYKNSEIHLAKM